MAQFITPLKYQRLSNKWVVLLDDLVFSFTLVEVMGKYSKDLLTLMNATGMSAYSTIHIVVPRGFVTDLASVPEKLHFIFKPDGDYAPAAVLHDMIYQSVKEDTMIFADDIDTELLNAHHTRLFADRIFLTAMRTVNVDYISRKLIYAGVRLGGSSSYGGIDTREDYGVKRVKPADIIPEPYQIFRKQVEAGLPAELSELSTKAYEWHKIKFVNLKRSFMLPTVLPG